MAMNSTDLPEFRYGVEDGVLWIEDLSEPEVFANNVAVVNDISKVIRYLFSLLKAGTETLKAWDLKKQWIVYRDVYGYWDRVCVENGEFLEFRPVLLLNRQDAIQAVKEGRYAICGCRRA